MNLFTDSRIVLTLDAGGTTFEFNAIQSGKILLEPVIFSSGDLSKNELISMIIEGFTVVTRQLKERTASAISFCFPGPADYENGIIGDLENIPAFKGGVPLKAILEDHFQIPVFINNDGDLFTLGEAMVGLLNEINTCSTATGNTHQYHSLLGITLGTGFGSGFVYQNKILFGENGAAFEINRMSSRYAGLASVEDVCSIRGIKRLFAKYSGLGESEIPEPKEINAIAEEVTHPYHEAAIQTWEEFGTIAGDAIVNAVTLTDSNVVIGGGPSKAWKWFMPSLIKAMNEPFRENCSKLISRAEIMIYNWEDETQRIDFLNSKQIELKVGSKTIFYDPVKRVCVGVSRLGTAGAVALGAYAFALEKMGSN